MSSYRGHTRITDRETVSRPVFISHTVLYGTLSHKAAIGILTINVPLFKKLRDIIFFWWDNHFMSHFEGHFEGVKIVEAPSKCPEK